jgi:hypothetical protein
MVAIPWRTETPLNAPEDAHRVDLQIRVAEIFV